MGPTRAAMLSRHRALAGLGRPTRYASTPNMSASVEFAAFNGLLMCFVAYTTRKVDMSGVRVVVWCYRVVVEVVEGVSVGGQSEARERELRKAL